MNEGDTNTLLLVILESQEKIARAITGLQAKAERNSRALQSLTFKLEVVSNHLDEIQQADIDSKKNWPKLGPSWARSGTD